MMKKTMLATGLAVLALGAQAQSTVQLMGLVDAYAGSMRMAGDAESKSVVGSGGMTTSWWGMTGTEDLGGGMKAGFTLTSFFQTDTGATGRFGDPQFSRDANVSLSSELGTLTLGRGKAPNFLPTILFNPMGDSYTFSPLVLHSSVPVGPFGAYRWTGTVPADTGWSNQITYSSPTFGGLKGNLHYQFGEQGTGVNESAHNVGFNLFYSAGPLGLTAYWERDEINNPFPPNAVLASGTQTAWMMGGTYDASVVKLFVTTGKSSNAANTIDKQTTSLGVSAPLGAGKLLAAVARTNNDVANTSRTTTTVGYDYTLSKRTDLYAMLMRDEITSFDSGTSLGLGVRHRF
ncbi:outer membrane porin protein 32 [Rhodoferax lithotrophicus]|uniref:Outer membrane porin protein 32 n=2 Tax=Rhodoferax lithotrophicus TaxID=2798804 RepID=A0ABN6DE23_9BURK|nr:outer membrane porin protein 32 [Rhodoferax sp. MIZ03]